MGRIVKNFLGAGELRIATPSRQVEMDVEQQTTLNGLLDGVKRLKADRALQPDYELTLLSAAREQDMLEIDNVKQQIMRQLDPVDE